MPNTHNLKKFSTFPLCLAGFLTQALIISLWLRDENFFLILSLHFTSCLFLSLAFILHKKSGMNEEYHAVFLFGLFLTFCFPLFGIVISTFIITSVQHFLPKSKHELYQEYEEFLQEDDKEKINLNNFKNILHEIRNEVSFEPFIDIIKGHNTNTKERVIEKLSHNINSSSIKILKLAIGDPSAAIRLSAANALLKIEETINKKIQIAIKMTKERGSKKDFSDLGDIYRMYANIGLMEEKSLNDYMALATQAYKQSLDIDTNQENVVIHYAQCLIAIKEHKKSYKFLDHAAKIWPNNNSINLFKAETSFHLHKINDIQNSLKQLNFEELNPEQKQIVEYWI